MTQTSIRCAQISTRQTSLAAPMPLDDAALQQVAGGVLSYTTGLRVDGVPRAPKALPAAGAPHLRVDLPAVGESCPCRSCAKGRERFSRHKISARNQLRAEFLYGSRETLSTLIGPV